MGGKVFDSIDYTSDGVTLTYYKIPIAKVNDANLKSVNSIRFDNCKLGN